jgi:Domain of unknown function (DUF4249)
LTKYSYIIVLIFSICFTACEEDIQLYQRDFVPSVVVNSIFTVGKPWSVNLTFSKNRLDPKSQITAIENAEVVVIERQNGRIIILNHDGNGIYSSIIYPAEPDKTYELVIKVPDYEVVKARSVAPKKAQLSIISDVIEKLEFEIKDSKQNYYIWNLVYTNTQNPLDTINSTDPKNLVNGIKTFNNLSSYIKEITDPKSNDAIKDGKQQANYSFDIEKFEAEGGGATDPIKKKYIRLLTASKELYDYYKTVEKYNVSEHHNCSFCQTPEIASNVVGGLGIFAGYTEEFKEIK